jgi:uncharacterized protein with FMN-binding domain
VLIGLIAMSIGAVVAKGAVGQHHSATVEPRAIPVPLSPRSSAGGSRSSATAGTASPATAGTASPATAGSASPATAGSASPALSSEKLDGAAESFPYGTIQVQVVLRGGKIVDVSVLQAPQDGYSSQVAQFAFPALRKEVIAAQSARIDVVSGASYDSQAYAASVQSALDRTKT